MAIYAGNGMVWDAEKNKPLCKFVNQMFKTTDPYVKNKLDKLGFIADRDDEIVIIEDDIQGAIDEIHEVEIATDEDIRALGKALGIKSYWNKNIDSLKEEISEKEGA